MMTDSTRGENTPFPAAPTIAPEGILSPGPTYKGPFEPTHQIRNQVTRRQHVGHGTQASASTCHRCGKRARPCEEQRGCERRF